MWIYIKLAFRNMLRNKRRSLIAGTGMGLGLASLIFVDALMIGMERNMVETATATFLGDGQIQQEEFRDTMQAELTINRFDQVIEQLKQEEAVKRFSVRTMAYGTISSAANFSSVEIVGIDPESEKDISEVDEAIIEGSYFEGDNARDIVIGVKLADLLEVDLGDRLVGTLAQAETGDLSQELFRVSGIFSFNITEMDRAMVFVRLPRAQEMLGIARLWINGIYVAKIAVICTTGKKGSVRRFGKRLQVARKIVPCWRDLPNIRVNVCEPAPIIHGTENRCRRCGAVYHGRCNGNHS